jgi:hypothetical protein
MARVRLACVGGIALGLGIGYYVLQLRPAWPPANGLDRFLRLVLPMVLTIEFVAGLPRVPTWFAWSLRILMASLLGRILLHGSVYLSGPSSELAAGQGIVLFIVCGALSLVIWTLLVRLIQRSPGVSVPIALALTIQCAGVAVMLAGYIKGGAAAIPLAATVAGGAIASRLVLNRSDQQATVGIAVVGLCGLLGIGRFFGGLSTAEALTLLFAPLLCWATELPRLRNQRPWVVGAIRLALVAVPLLVLLALAKREFDRETAPLLIKSISVSAQDMALASRAGS